MKLQDITAKATNTRVDIDIETHANTSIHIKAWGFMADSVFTEEQLRNTDCAMIYCPFISLMS